MTQVSLEGGAGGRPEPGMPAQPAPRARLEILEGLRFVAALGIVWFHIHAPGSGIASGALALFLVLTSYFATLSLTKVGPRDFWTSRVMRVLLPWLAWCGFYLVVNAVRLHGLAPALRLENPWAVFIGPSIHLWFLPWVLISAVPIMFLAPRIMTGRAIAVAAVIAVPICVAMLWVAEGTTMPPFEQWTVATTPTIYGLLAAAALRLDRPLVAPLFLAATVAGCLAVSATEALEPLVIGVVAFELGRRATWRVPGLRALGRLSFGIYLIHPFFIYVLFKFGGNSGSVAAALAVFAASALATAVMLRLPWVRSLV